MNAEPISPIYDHFLSFVVEKITPGEMLAFDIPADLRQRAVVLLDKQDADTLTPEEADEMAQMQQMDRLVSALKARALAASTRS